VWLAGTGIDSTYGLVLQVQARLEMLCFRRGSCLSASSPSSGWSGRHLDLGVKSTTDCSQSAKECAKFLEIKNGSDQRLGSRSDGKTPLSVRNSLEEEDLMSGRWRSLELSRMQALKVVMQL
jgi:hypothetical protein